MIRFVNRNRELNILNRDWNNLNNGFIVIYGRRRIGKTKLIEEFVKDKKGISYTAEDTSKKIQIREFKDAIASFLDDDFLKNQEIVSWSSLFEYLQKVLDRNKRFYIWIDEFSYLLKNDKSLPSILQKFIDKFLRNSKIFFIVSGSLFGLMKEKVLSNSSPLYGRRTRDILLRELNFEHAIKFVNFNFEDKLKTFLTIGGIPEYLLVASKFKTYEEFIKQEFFTHEGYFYREPYFLLSQEFKEIRIYFSILNAIAYGNTKPSEIANFVGIKTREIYPYLELLNAYGFVTREKHLFKEKLGIYLIKDCFFDFWFNFVHKNRELIERGAYELNKKKINTYLGKRFEIFIKDNFHYFFKDYTKIGRWWHKDREIDIVAINEKNKQILACECKWQSRVNAEKIAKELNEKLGYVDWQKDKRKESFAIFAKSFSKRIKEWQGKPVYCFDLKDLEKAMKHKTKHKKFLKSK